MEDAVTKNGLDVDIAKLSNCPYHSMDECQEKCEKYYRCYTISLANDLYWWSTSWSCLTLAQRTRSLQRVAMWPLSKYILFIS